jgi:hypothetical protein
MHRRNRPDENGDATIDRELLAELDREEPLSLAEELDKAAERVRRFRVAAPESISGQSVARQIRVSRTSARAVTAPRVRPAGRVVGRSLRLCTATSISPSPSAR